MSKSNRCYAVFGADDKPERGDVRLVCVFLNQESACEFSRKDNDRFVEEVELVAD